MKNTPVAKIVLAAVALLVVVILALNCVTQVPTGSTGIVTTFGRVEDYTLEAGFHLKSPAQRVILMDNREQKKAFTTGITIWAVIVLAVLTFEVFVFNNRF